MAKRRFIDLLPGINQTDPLKKYFGSTVDHLFQPGSAEKITGYIGQRPSYTKLDRDFYLRETTALRHAHQLEPALVRYDALRANADVFNYDDLIAYLRNSGAVTCDQNRLFSDFFYTWAPPIDIDKIQNFSQYIWVGDAPHVVPILTLRASSRQLIADGVSYTFDLPERIAGLPASHEEPMVFVDTRPVEFERQGDALALVYTPVADAEIIIYRYGSLRTLVEGMRTFDPSPFLASDQGVTALTSTMRIALDDGASRFRGFGTLPFDASFVHDTQGQRLDANPWDPDEATTVYFVEGVGQSIVLVPYYEAPAAIADRPMHVTIDRRSGDGNPWSRDNYWIHRDAYAWSKVDLDDRRASRPIIEFVPDLELFNYGRSRLPDISGTLTGDPYYCPTVFNPQVYNSPVTDYDVEAFDTVPYESPGFTFLPLAQANGKRPGTIQIDGQRRPVYGDRILILDNPNPDLSGRILTIAKAVIARDGTMQEVMAVSAGPAPEEGDITRLPVRGHIPYDDQYGFDAEPFDYSPLPIEYIYDGSSWQIAQSRGLTQNDPAFNLYTDDGVAHGDLVSSFAGNRLFGFEQGTVSRNVDPVLDRVLAYDASGKIVFRNDLSTIKTSTSSPRLSGYAFYKRGERFENGWQATKDRSVQGVTDDGVYAIPLNLTANADNEEVDTISRGQSLEHFTQIIQRQVGFAGSAYRDNTYRDTSRDLTLGRAILQHRSPLLKTMLLASDRTFDYFEAVRFAEAEYARFRTKFTAQIGEVLRTGQRLVDDRADDWVVTILKNLRATKTNDFPWALSGVGGGQFFIPPTAACLGILPAIEPGIEVDDTYSPALRFLRGHDGSRTPLFDDIRDVILLALERRIYAALPDAFKDESKRAFELLDHVEGRFRVAQPGATCSSDADGNGSCSAALPGTYTDTDSAVVYKDPIVTDATLRYTRKEFVSLYSPMFLRWTQVNGLDYRQNSGWIADDPFTWNFHGISDRYGTAMPGSWRAIYRYYFDTDRPHAAPWEMLGFADKPAWFDDQYGSAPYTRSNSVLWDDLSRGLIRQGARAGRDARFVRPDLWAVLPVDEAGRLIDPVAAGIIKTLPTYQQASKAWEIGDHGPVENLWHASTSHRFAAAQLGALMRPAAFVEAMWETLDLTRQENGQWFSGRTHNRPRAASIKVHGELDAAGKPVAVLGIQQWIVEAMIARAQEPRLLGDALRGMSAQLIHRMGGFTQGENLRVFADNFGLVPSEDVNVLYHESPPIREVFYSGVIVEWTGAGWRVVGYDTMHNAFCTMPGEEAGPTYTINTGLADPIVYEWRAAVYYPINRIIEFQGSTYRAVASHTSGPTFEPEFWAAAPNVSRRTTPTVQIPLTPTGEIISVDYNTVFDTYQGVANFLSGYGRYLEAVGFVFDATDPVTGEVHDWNQAIREFLIWAQMEWEPGNFIALSPGAAGLHFVTAHGTVYNIEDTNSGFYGLVDRTGRPIPPKSTFITRLDETTQILTQNDDLYGARLRVGEVEHVVVFNNRTLFNDVMYVPLYNLRQPRLRLNGLRSTPWAGRRDAPGYVIEGNNLLPSFAKASDDLRQAFEVEGSDDRTLREHARHVVGFQTRPYLDNLLISETSQFEFYQGAIRRKGTPSVFDRLTRSTRVDGDSDLRFLEEWAFKTGRFGAVNRCERFAFTITRTDARMDPQLVIFGEALGPTDAAIRVPAGDPRWVAEPANARSLFPDRTDPATEFTTCRGFDMEPASEVPFDLDPVVGGPQLRVRQGFLRTPGYVRTTEVDHFSFTPDLLPTLYEGFTETMTPGTRIWVYDMTLNGFDVLFSQMIAQPNTSDDNPARAISKIIGINEDDTLDGQTRIVFTLPHGLRQSDVDTFICIASETFTTPDLQGFYRIAKVETDTAILINAVTSYGRDYSIIAFDTGSPVDSETQDEDPSPYVYALRSQRYINTTVRDGEAQRFPPIAGQFAYIDDNGHGRWAVYLYDAISKTWILVREQPDRLDTGRLASALVYRSGERVTDQMLYVNEILVDGITVIDPLSGLLPGLAEREITYKTEYDPARYDQAEGDAWGREKVGLLWWNLATVRYLDPQTDIVSDGDAVRRAKEINYRVNNWATIAPGSSMDIYEWTRALTAPTEGVTSFNDDGSIDFVERREFDEASRSMVTTYYFWVRNPSQVPNRIGREISAAEVANLLIDPRGTELPWIAPITNGAILVGGIAPYLDSTASTLQFEIVDPTIEGVVHTEHLLVRPDDARARPPADLWRAMRDSLVGFDAFRHTVPDPALAPSDAIGTTIRPRRTMFADGITGRLAARRTFLQMVNRILAASNRLADRPTLPQDLSLDSPAFAWLINSAREGRYFDLPPAGSYDFVVTTMEERDALLPTRAFALAAGYRPFGETRFGDGPFDQDPGLAALPSRRAPRVLVQNFGADIPTWSIWDFDLTADLTDDPTECLSLARGYDLVVADRAELADVMAIAPLAEGERVLIQSDPDANGFWTIHRYLPSLASGTADGFVFETAQTYRTGEFLEEVDWYGTYRPNEAPVVVYADTKARDLAEGPDPVNRFVRLTDDGTGRWAWASFNGTKWVIVARERASIALSSLFIEPNRPVYAQGSPVLADIPFRDGAIELQVLAHALYAGVLSNEELNQVFFALLHFAHTQQSEVTFAFKTAFMTVLGGGETIGQTPILTLDNTENLLSYIDEVKPYRVRTRDYTKILRPDIDSIDMAATDFDKPVYFDPLLQRYRRLDLANPGDRVVLATSPWDDWYAVYGSKIGDPQAAAMSPVRKMKLGLAFDRVDPLGTTALTPTHALARMLAYYEPGLSMVARNAAALFGQRDHTVDGGDAYVPKDPDNLSEFDIRPYDLLPYDVRIATEIDTILSAEDNPILVFNPDDERKAYGLIDPYHNPDNPQELLGLTPNDTLMVQVKEDWSLGQPVQSVVSYDTRRESGTVTLSFRHLAQANDALSVYRDGVRLFDGEYTVDHFTRTVRLDLQGARSVMIGTFGVAGLSALSEQLTVSGGLASYPLRRPGRAAFEIIQDGVRLPADRGTITGNRVALSPVPAEDTDVLINVYATDATLAATATHVMRERLPPTDTKQWDLANPTSLRSGSGLAHARTIVEYQGLTLSPAFTRYGRFTRIARLIPFREVDDLSTISITLDGEPYTEGLGRSEADGMPIILKGGSIIALDPTLMADQVVIVDEARREFTVTQDGTLSVDRTITFSDYDCAVDGFDTYAFDLNDTFHDDFRLEATTFRNADLMGIEAHTFAGAKSGTYAIDSEVAGSEYLWVTLDGKRLRAGEEYTVTRRALGFSDEAWGYMFDILDEQTIITLLGEQHPWQTVLARAFTGRPAGEENVVTAATARPAITRMGSRARGGDYDQTPFDSVGCDTIAAISYLSSQGVRPVYRMEHAFDFLPWKPEAVASLREPVDAGSSVIRLALNPLGLSHDLIPVDLPLPSPQDGRPGAVFINGERIEYWGIARSGNEVTLTGLRRETRGTHGPVESRLQAILPADGHETTFHLDAGEISAPIEVGVSENGVLVARNLGPHYALSQVETGVLVVFTSPPAAGSHVVIGQSRAALHPAGSYAHTGVNDDETFTGPFRRQDAIDYTKVV